MLLGAMLAMALVVVAPAAVAQVSQGESEISSDTGEVAQDVNISSETNEASQRQVDLFPQVGTTSEVTQPPPAPAPKVEEKKAAPPPAPKVAEKKELPKTGGGASLLALGAGALLVAGGLLARGILR
jgi:LPXTG-motif cell wall-anchored protein